MPSAAPARWAVLAGRALGLRKNREMQPPGFCVAEDYRELRILTAVPGMSQGSVCDVPESG